MLENLKKILGKRGLKGHWLAGCWVDEFYPPGVKALPGQPFFLLFPPIDKVSQKRMPYAGHVYAYLVGAAGFKPTSNVGVPVIAGDYLIMCYRRAGVLVGYAHSLAVRGMAADWRVYGAAVVADAPADNGLIFTGQAPVRKL